MEQANTNGPPEDAYALVMGAPTSTAKGKPDFKLAVEAGVRNEKGKLLI